MPSPRPAGRHFVQRSLHDFGFIGGYVRSVRMRGCDGQYRGKETVRRMQRQVLCVERAMQLWNDLGRPSFGVTDPLRIRFGIGGGIGVEFPGRFYVVEEDFKSKFPALLSTEEHIMCKQQYLHSHFPKIIRAMIPREWAGNASPRCALCKGKDECMVDIIARSCNDNVGE